MLKRDKARICNLIRAGHRKEIQELLDHIKESDKICPRCLEPYPIEEYQAEKTDREYDYCTVCRKAVHKAFRVRCSDRITLK